MGNKDFVFTRFSTFHRSTQTSRSKFDHILLLSTRFSNGIAVDLHSMALIAEEMTLAKISKF